MTLEQLEAARAERMRQNDHGAITIEDVRTWIEETGLCIFLPRSAQAGFTAPTFVEAVAGRRTTEPTLELIRTAETLLVRLEGEGVAVRLSLSGQPGDQPDYVVASWVLPYIYALRGDRDWRRTPQLTGSRQVSPLAVQTAKQLELGNQNAIQIRDALGREVTETAILRALHELWKQLRVIPVVSEVGVPALWQPLRQRFQKAIAEGASTSQVTAISVLASIYLQAVIAASMEDVEMFLSPLTSRSKIREVVRGLAATRQVHSTQMGHLPMFYVAGTLPEFPTTPNFQISTSFAGYRGSSYIGLDAEAAGMDEAYTGGRENGHRGAAAREMTAAERFATAARQDASDARAGHAAHQSARVDEETLTFSISESEEVFHEGVSLSGSEFLEVEFDVDAIAASADADAGMDEATKKHQASRRKPLVDRAAIHMAKAAALKAAASKAGAKPASARPRTEARPAPHAGKTNARPAGARSAGSRAGGSRPGSGRSGGAVHGRHSGSVSNGARKSSGPASHGAGSHGAGSHGLGASKAGSRNGAGNGHAAGNGNVVRNGFTGAKAKPAGNGHGGNGHAGKSFSSNGKPANGHARPSAGAMSNGSLPVKNGKGAAGVAKPGTSKPVAKGSRPGAVKAPVGAAKPRSAADSRKATQASAGKRFGFAGQAKQTAKPVARGAKAAGKAAPQRSGSAKAVSARPGAGKSGGAKTSHSSAKTSSRAAVPAKRRG